ncbi:alpha/beta hydrolase [Paenibacillus yonginensis]|uniref:Alpha/beta hydrolase n=1 Tax=Paenibacillus yonginensis TaxID=1462996 RepID=A0A1B1N304_9BACL|nr:alpha/beta hydrolase [Paenibacillus yonginensis]ANS75814.1 alpha/beta hydrolase [Paenibacillus yonginensis]
MEKLSVNGLNIAYEDRGEGEVIVLLHGFCGSAGYWDALVPELSKQYRCLVPDLRGHGSSDAPLGSYTIEQMAEDVKGLLEKLEISSCTMLGHSMGGYVTLAFAQHYPAYLKGFGLIHSTAYADSEEAKEKRLKAAAAVQSGITGFIDGLVPGLFAPDHVDTMADAVNAVREIGYRTPPQGAAGAALAMRERVDRRDVLSSTMLPVLLVAGEKDQVVPIERTFTADGANITKSVLKGAGHMSMYETPEQLLAVISDFARSIYETDKAGL